MKSQTKEEDKPRYELGRFASGEVKLVVRFHKGKNVWIQNDDEITWCPEFDVLDEIKEFTTMVDDYNINKRKKINAGRFEQIIKNQY
jgi:hypothetical protein